MAENSKIEWTDHTFNPWMGCTKVSPACDNCYAETLVTGRMGKDVWGPGKPRALTSIHNWNNPLRWDRKAKKDGTRPRVFCASLADVFDNEVPDEWRERLWALIEATPNLDWLLLTKRIGNAKKMLPAHWQNRTQDNVWLGATIANQAEADRDIPKLIATRARIRFLSMEPLLGHVDIRQHIGQRAWGEYGFLPVAGVDWVITGGESGTHARPANAEWYRSLRDQCAAAGVPFHFKQWGEFDEHEARIGKKKAGRLLDGRTWDGVPA